MVPIFFADYDPTLQSGVTDFVTQLALLQSYTSATLSEYGVAGLTAGTPIVLTEDAPVGTTTTPYDDSSIESWLATKLTSNDPQFGTADPSTIYTIFFPASTTISLGQSMTGQPSLSCQDFGGYHNNIDLAAGGADAGADAGTQPIAYAVIPSCTDFHNLSGIDMITGAASHEIAEASTDPFPAETLTGFSDVDQNHIVWDFALGGGEIGDMCAQYDDAFFKPSGFDYYVQRMWSNAAALAGHDPCVPVDASVYFNSAANLPDMVTLPFGGITTQGVKVLTGDSQTIEIDLFSDGATTGPWTVTATEPTMGAATSLELSLDRSTGVNGEKLHLTIKTVTPNTYGLSVVLLTSTLGAQTTYWAGSFKRSRNGEVFDLFKTHRRKALRAEAMPEAWRAIIDENVRYATLLPADERSHLDALVRIFVAEKRFEGCGGLVLTDEMKVTIAAQACLLLLHREGDIYPDLESILVYPHAYRAKGEKRDGALVVDADEARLGESWVRGVLILAWDHVHAATHHVASGNVVLHEFAHQLDAADGAMDGAPELDSRARYVSWARVLGDEYAELSARVQADRGSDIDPYGATNPAEFFAVVTEMFFERPGAMKRKHPELYEELRAFYGQDPAAVIAAAS